MRRGDEPDAALANRRRRHNLLAVANLVDDDDVRRVVLHDVDHDLRLV